MLTEEKKFKSGNRKHLHNILCKYKAYGARVISQNIWAIPNPRIRHVLPSTFTVVSNFSVLYIKEIDQHPQ